MRSIGKSIIVGGAFFVLVIALCGQFLTSFAFGTAWLFLIAGFFLLIAFLSKIKPDQFNLWLFVLFTLGLFLRLIFALGWHVEPMTDFGNIFHIASSLAAQPVPNWSLILTSMQTVYQNDWSIHMPYILYEALLLKLFAGNMVALLWANAVSGALSCVFTGLIARKIFNSRIGVMAGLLLCFNPVILFFTPVLTNQHLATTLFLASLFVFVCRPLKTSIRNILLTSVLLAASQLARPEMAVVLIALTCFILWESYKYFKQKKTPIKARMFHIVKRLSALMIPFLLIVLVVNLVLLQTKIITKPPSQNLIYKIAVGLNQDSNGRYSIENKNTSVDEQKLSTSIADELKDPVAVFGLILKKQMFQFGTYNYSWPVLSGVGRMLKTDAISKTIYNPLTSSYMFFITFLVLLGVVKNFRTRNNRYVLLLLVILGYFVTFSIIEVQDRYNFLLIPLFTILAANAFLQMRTLGRFPPKQILSNDSGNAHSSQN